MKSMIPYLVLAALIILVLVLTVVAPYTDNILDGADKTSCQQMREEYYVKYEFSDTEFSDNDIVILEQFKSDMALKLNIRNPDDYVFDMWSCAFFTKEEARQGKILEYRKQLGLK